MNWRSLSLSRFFWKNLLTGGFVGALASALSNAALILTDGWLSGPTAAVLSGAVLGLGLAAGLAVVELLHRWLWARLPMVLAAGAAPGALIGAVAMLIVERSQSNEGALLQFITWLVALTLLAGAGALASALGRWGNPGFRNKLLLALSCGAVTALPAAYLLTFHGASAAVFLAAITGWSALNAIGTFWLSIKTAKRWLRVLSGPAEDHIYPLGPGRITVGALADNDVALPRYPELFPMHCYLEWEKNHYNIIDDEQGGLVQVNYRHVREHPLKNGDLVKIGSALLQYGELS